MRLLFILALGLLLFGCTEVPEAEEPVDNLTMEETVDMEAPATIQSECSNLDCPACIEKAGCGWCSNIRKCLVGSALGSDDGTCHLPNWNIEDTGMSCS